ncbi:MAG: PucR family transcriptional regulator ligand-binding domain-containing protein [Eubacterium sp.]|nr:PucR family transcriptional regulator ligand-binding domain-containing protein [Eubacterium sp.]MEE0184474.1 PucR family transcriptional regulator ligand-binding domain-containing protein [Lachnospira sp.]
MFECKDLLTLPSMAQAKIIAGKSGLSNSIRWVYKPENMNFAKWVKGQELLIISTPVIKSQDFNLPLVIKKANKLNMSGALLLTGDKYIASIDSSVVSYANLNNFPIFVISGEIPLVDIFEEIGHAIAYNKNSDALSDDILSGIIFGKNINEDAFAMKFSEAGYALDGKNRMFTINIHGDRRIEEYEYDTVISKIKNEFNSGNMNALLSRYGNNIVGCFCLKKGEVDVSGRSADINMSGNNISEIIPVDSSMKNILDTDTVSESDKKEVLAKIYKSLSEYLYSISSDIKLVMGVGRAYEGIGDLQKSFTEASRCVILSEKMNMSGRVFCYEEMGIYNLFSELADKKVMQEFIDNTLGVIIEYDRNNNSKLLETLKAYLWNNNSLIHASEQLYTHRNTVKYRVQRISQLTGRDFDDAITRLEFMNAIICMEIS